MPYLDVHVHVHTRLCETLAVNPVSRQTGSAHTHAHARTLSFEVFNICSNSSEQSKVDPELTANHSRRSPEAPGNSAGVGYSQEKGRGRKTGSAPSAPHGRVGAWPDEEIPPEGNPPSPSHLHETAENERPVTR